MSTRSEKSSAKEDNNSWRFTKRYARRGALIGMAAGVIFDAIFTTGLFASVSSIVYSEHPSIALATFLHHAATTSIATYTGPVVTGGLIGAGYGALAGYSEDT